LFHDIGIHLFRGNRRQVMDYAVGFVARGNAAHDFRLRSLPASVGDERRGPSDAGGHHD
jgi:UDP-galactopyranose mutase